MRTAEHLAIEIRQADLSLLPEAFAIVQQYYAAFAILEPESRQEFAAHYFGSGNGFWLAWANESAVGCIGLRRLAGHSGSGEVKRLYVDPAFRHLHIATRLLAALEQAALACGYEWLYLDSNENFAAALRFYRHHGYEDCQRYNNNRQATIFLRKRLLASCSTPPRPDVR